MRKLFRNDYNNNPGTIQKKVKHSVFKTITNEKGKKKYIPDWFKIKGYDKNFVQISIEQSFFLGETVQVEVMVNKRKVTRNIIDEKTGRVLEVETEVTTDDSDEDIVNPDGTIGKKPKRKMRRGKTGGQNLDGGDPGGRRRRRRTTTISGQQ